MSDQNRPRWTAEKAVWWSTFGFLVLAPSRSSASGTDPPHPPVPGATPHLSKKEHDHEPDHCPPS